MTVFPAPPGTPPDDLDDETAGLPPAIDGPHRHEPTPLEELRAELSAQVEVPEVTWEVKSRPGYAVRYRTDVSEEDFKRLTKAATRRRRRPAAGEPPDVDELAMSANLLATYSVALLRHGVELLDDDGDPLTLRSYELMDLLGLERRDSEPADSVKRLYGLDGYVLSAARALMDESGWTDSPDEVAPPAGPTRRR